MYFMLQLMIHLTVKSNGAPEGSFVSAPKDDLSDFHKDALEDVFEVALQGALEVALVDGIINAQMNTKWFI